MNPRIVLEISRNTASLIDTQTDQVLFQAWYNDSDIENIVRIFMEALPDVEIRRP